MLFIFNITYTVPNFQNNIREAVNICKTHDNKNLSKTSGKLNNSFEQLMYSFQGYQFSDDN